MQTKPAQLQRLLWLYHAFHDAPEGTIASAALDAQYDAWQVDRKTTIRDRKELESWAGAQILRYDASSRVWKLLRRFEIPEFVRSLRPVPDRQEILLATARHVLRSTQGRTSQFAGALEANVDEDSPYVSVFAPPRLGRDSAKVSELWLQVHQAITERRRLILSREGKESVRVDPLHLWWAQGGWYLLARGSDDGTLRNHALARLESVSDSVQTSRGKHRPDLYPPSDFDPKQWLGNGDWLYRGGKKATARIRFDANAVAAFRDRLWQTDIAWQERDDGTVILLHPYPASAHGEWEMARRILGWGEYCVVEAPASLRSRIKQLLEDVARRYA